MGKMAKFYVFEEESSLESIDDCDGDYSVVYIFRGGWS